VWLKRNLDMKERYRKEVNNKREKASLKEMLWISIQQF
jgi:hypothetical protein